MNLQLIHLCEESESRNDSDVERALAALPNGLDNTYERSLDQIWQHNERRRRLAFQTLRWVMYADRPLTVRELQYAVAAEEPRAEGQEAQTNDWKFLVSISANLLEVVPPNSPSGTVRPIHYSVQEFITTTLDPRIQCWQHRHRHPSSHRASLSSVVITSRAPMNSSSSCSQLGN